MGLIPQQTLDDIQNRLDIAELIGGYVPLKRAGRHWKANCPFHREKTPSFMVNVEKQIFHCFGCSTGGNVFSFLMQYEHLEFPEAVRMLAERVGVTLPAPSTATTTAPTTMELYRANDAAAAYFQRALHSAAGAPVRAYLAKRGLTEHTWRAFGMGYAPADWEGLLTAARQEGLAVERLAEAGLVVRGTTGQWRDRFHQRLIFPIRDVRGRIVGFGGRILDRSEPKYLNSPESPIYTKGRHLYGLEIAKTAIAHEGYAIIVEGYVDCVALHQQGFTQTVSPLGTALTVEQLRLLKRYTREAVMAFDADTAGEAAVIRDMDSCLDEGLQVRVVQLPAGQDPDEYALREGAEAFAQLVRNASSLFEYKLQWLMRQHDVQRLEGRVTVCQAMLSTLLRVDNDVLRQGYVHQLAETLRLDEASIANELKKLARNTKRSIAGQPPSGAGAMVKSALTTASGPERFLIGAMLTDHAMAQRIQQELDMTMIGDPVLRHIAAAACAMLDRGEPISPAALVSRLDDPALGALVSQLVADAEPHVTNPQAIDEPLRRLREQYRKTHVAAMSASLRTAHQNHDESTVTSLLHELTQGGT